MGKVKANAMVTNKDYPPEFINSFINLFKYAQQFYGQRNSDEFSFSMFFSPLPYSDLIFQDAAQKIIIIPEGKFLEIVGRKDQNQSYFVLQSKDITRRILAENSLRHSRRLSAPMLAPLACHKSLLLP